MIHLFSIFAVFNSVVLALTFRELGTPSAGSARSINKA